MAGPTTLRWMLPGLLVGAFLIDGDGDHDGWAWMVLCWLVGGTGLLRSSRPGVSAMAAFLVGVGCSPALLFADATRHCGPPSALPAFALQWVEVTEAWAPIGREHQCVAVDGAGRRILLQGPAAFPVGKRLLVGGSPTPFETPEHPFDFDEGAFLRGRGIVGKWRSCRVAKAEIAAGFMASIRRWSAEWAGKVRQRMLDSGSGAGPALLVALTTGDKRGLDRRTRQAFAQAGLSHLMAVSGFHTGMVAGLIWWLLIPWRGFPVIRTAAMVLAVWAYVGICGFPGSAVRAALMVTAAGLAAGMHRKPDGLTVLSGTGILMLCTQPCAFRDMGLQMSFMATAAIMLLHRRVSLTRGSGIKGKWLLVSGIPLVATLATAPLTWPRFGIMPIIFLPANLIMTPCVTGLSMASALWFMTPRAWDVQTAPLLIGAARRLVMFTEWLADVFPALLLPMDQGVVALAGSIAAAGLLWALLSRTASFRILIGGLLGVSAVLRSQDHLERQPNCIVVEQDAIWVEDGRVTVFPEDGTPGNARRLKWKTRTFSERVSMETPDWAQCPCPGLCFSPNRLRFRLPDGTWSGFNSSRSRCGSPDPHTLPRPPCP